MAFVKVSAIGSNQPRRAARLTERAGNEAGVSTIIVPWRWDSQSQAGVVKSTRDPDAIPRGRTGFQWKFGQGRDRNAGLSTLATLPQLQRLRISAPNKITAKGLAQLGDFKELRHFDFNQSSGSEKDLLPFGDAEVKHLERLTNLKSLRIVPASLTDAGFASLAKITSLESLDLYGGNLTPEAIANLRPLANLRSLSLTGMAIDDACLGEIGLLPLSELRLAAIDVSDAGLAKLAECESLRKIDLSAGPRSTLGDSGVAQLAGLKELTHLRVYGDRLTAESLKIVEHLPRLEQLTITSRLIKIEQKQEIQKKFPRCVIAMLFE